MRRLVLLVVLTGLALAVLQPAVTEARVHFKTNNRHDTPPPHRPLPPVITCVGTHYECGVTVGSEAKHLITYRLTQPDVMSAKKASETTRGKLLMQRFINNTDKFAHHVGENLKGIADGVGVAYRDIMLLNSLSAFHDINNLQHSTGSPQCTDVLVQTDPTRPVWGHNEDNAALMYNTTYIINATILADHNSKTVLERFFVYAYPGTFGGNYFGFNVHGIVVSDNFIFNRIQNFDTNVPTTIAVRLLYGAKTIEEAVMICINNRGVIGHNVNLASTKPDKRTGKFTMLNVEVDPMTTDGVHQVKPPADEDIIPGTPVWPSWYPHANMFRVLNISQNIDNSSVHRVARLEELGRARTPKTTEDLRTMLGDDSDPIYPIYRDGGDKADDNMMTLATVVFDLAGKTATVWTSNPKDNDPDVTFDLW